MATKSKSPKTHQQLFELVGREIRHAGAVSELLNRECYPLVKYDSKTGGTSKLETSILETIDTLNKYRIALDLLQSELGALAKSEGAS